MTPADRAAAFDALARGALVTPVDDLAPLQFDGDEPAASTRLHSATFGDPASATVVDAGPQTDGGSVLLAVVQRAAVDDAAVHLGAPDGPRLARVELPYAVPEPVPPRGRIA
jgi:hypothetical protein